MRGGRRVWVALPALAAMVAIATGVFVSASGRRGRLQSPPALSPKVPAPTTTTRKVPRVNMRYRPSYLPTPANVPGQASITSSFPIAELETLRPPKPAYSSSLPPVPVADRSDPIAYARAFVTELLNIDFARTSRVQLAGWAQAEASAELLPGVPFAAAKSSLFASLFDPTIGGGSRSGSPLPSRAAWRVAASERMTWRVSGLTVGYDEAWQRAFGKLNAENIELPDPLMTVIDVSGTLRITRLGHRASRGFRYGVGVGSALHHPGYGASVVGGF